MIVLSCGHKDTNHPHGWEVHFKEEGCDALEGYYPRVSHYSYCSKCFAYTLLTFPENLCKDEYEVEQYFSEYKNG